MIGKQIALITENSDLLLLSKNFIYKVPKKQVNIYGLYTRSKLQISIIQ